MEIDKASHVQSPLRLKESSDFVEESRCSFAKRTLSLPYGKIRSQYIFWALSLIPWEGRKSKKWWRCLMWFFVDVSIVNAYILEKLSPHHRSRTQLAFPLDLVKLLIANFSARRLSASSGRLEGGHWPIKFSKGRCKRCLKRNKETWCRMACELCGKRICLDCFKNHTADDLAWTLARNSKTRACKNLIFCNDFLKNWPPSRSKIALIILYHLFSSFNTLVRCSLSWNVTIFCEFMSNMDGFCWDFYSLNLSS